MAQTLKQWIAEAQKIADLEAKDAKTGGEFADDVHDARFSFDFDGLAAFLRTMTLPTMA